MRNNEFKVSREMLTLILKYQLDSYRRRTKEKGKERGEYETIYAIIREFRDFYGIEFEEDCGICSDEGCC